MQDQLFPTVYTMGAIGVQGAHEALEAFHFCSTTCRAQWLRDTSPYTDGGFETGAETLSVDEDVCTQCGKVLETEM